MTIQATLLLGDIAADLISGVAWRIGKRLWLHPLEFRFLVYLASKAPQVVTPKQLHEEVIGRPWSDDPDRQSNTVSVTISRLRGKLNEPVRVDYKLRTDFPQIIKTVPGGWVIVPEVSLVASTNK